MTRLVINADDLGLHPAIDAGILRAHREGVVTSATVLVTGPHAADAVKQAKAQGLSLGVHLCLTSQLPPVRSDVSSLAPNGLFRASWGQVLTARLRGALNLLQVEREFRAQLQRARELGAEPDHLDSHQHLHLLPGIREAVCQLALEEGLPVRWPMERPRLGGAPFGPAAKTALLTWLAQSPLPRPPRIVPAQGLLASGALDEGALLQLIERLPPGDHEILCHPGEDPGVVPQDPSWRYGWELELQALLSPRVRARLEAGGIQLCSYRELS